MLLKKTLLEIVDYIIQVSCMCTLFHNAAAHCILAIYVSFVIMLNFSIAFNENCNQIGSPFFIRFIQFFNSGLIFSGFYKPLVHEKRKC